MRTSFKINNSLGLQACLLEIQYIEFKQEI